MEPSAEGILIWGGEDMFKAEFQGYIPYCGTNVL
jgi:hypothetical protein